MCLIHQLPITQHALYCSDDVLTHHMKYELTLDLQCRFHVVHLYMRLFAARSRFFLLHTIHFVVIRIYLNILHICWKWLENETRTLVTNFQSFFGGFYLIDCRLFRFLPHVACKLLFWNVRIDCIVWYKYPKGCHHQNKSC